MKTIIVKRIFKLLLCIFGLVCFIKLGSYSSEQYDKETFVNVSGIVLSKFDRTQYNKSKCYEYFDLQIKTDDGKIFEISVTPNTYHNAKIGEKINFSNVFIGVVDENERWKFIWRFILYLAIPTISTLLMILLFIKNIIFFFLYDIKTLNLKL